MLNCKFIFLSSDKHKLLWGSDILVGSDCFPPAVGSLSLHCSDQVQLDVGSTPVITWEFWMGEGFQTQPIISAPQTQFFLLYTPALLIL